ncbi:HEAT repeat domain-containing protein [Nocardioides sp.]|uniref:HEAT repeat domain-containing protein n=1 Tax=Nocardioides sp. TaxID=35761 RepID=UPI00351552FF
MLSFAGTTQPFSRVARLDRARWRAIPAVVGRNILRKDLMTITPSTPAPDPDEAAAQAAAILDDLRNAGYVVASLHDLRESGTRYQDAVPVLASWLPRVTDFGLHESLLRALTVPFAKQAALQPVIDDFTRTYTGSEAIDIELRWVAGNALEVLWQDTAFDQLRDLCVATRWGRARQMVVLGMGKSKHLDAADTLIGLLDDDDVRLHAVQALRKLRPAAAREPLARLRDHHDGVMRKEIDKTLAKLAD